MGPNRAVLLCVGFVLSSATVMGGPVIAICGVGTGQAEIDACTTVIHGYEQKGGTPLASAYLKRGYAYLEFGQLDLAIADFGQAFKLASSPALVSNGRDIAIDTRTGQVVAKDSNDQSLNLIPTILNDRGVAYEQKGETDRAIQDYDGAILMKPQFPEALNDRCKAHNDRKEYDLAIADCSAAIRLKPDFTYPFVNRGVAYWGKGEFDQSILDYDEAIRLDPNYDNAYRARAMSYDSKGDHERAIQEFDKLLSTHPTDAETLNLRCYSRAQAGTALDRALADCNESLRIRPNNAATLDSRGFVYLRMGRLEESIFDYDAAISARPKSAPSLYGRGIARLRRGDQGGGKADLEAAKAVDPSISQTFARMGVAP